MMHAPLVITTKHYVLFVLPPLFIWLIKHPLGLALLPPGYGVEPVMQTNVDVVSHVDNGQNMNGFMRLDTLGYVRKHNHRPGDEHLCMRKSTGMHSLLSTVWRNPKKNQKWTLTWWCKTWRDEEHCTKLSNAHAWIHVDTLSFTTNGQRKNSSAK